MLVMWTPRNLTLNLLHYSPNDETASREEVRDLAVWCQDNNLSLNVSKIKELIMDNRKRKTEQALTSTGRGPRFLSSLVSTNEVSWSKHTKTLVKRAQQHLFPLG